MGGRRQIMNRTNKYRIGAAMFTATVFSAAAAFAGSLTPPAGPVGPTMKPLSEIEPRVAINAVNTPGDATSQFKITQSGSYYLTGGIAGVAGKHGILVTASNVSIDLGGFEVHGIGGASSGIKAPSAPVLTGISVRNGTLSGWGSIALDLQAVSGTRVSDVRAVANGAGIFAGSTAVVTNCSVIDNTAASLPGIYVGPKSVASHCSVSGSKCDGISADTDSVVSNCAASSNGDSGTDSGFRISSGVTLTGCSASGNFYAGVYIATSDATVSNCTMRNNDIGIYVQTASFVTGNSLADNNIGILVNGLRSRIDGNNVFDGAAIGIQADAGLANVIVRNTVQIQSNAANCYILGASNNVGTIVTLSATISTTNPWANFKN